MKIYCDMDGVLTDFIGDLQKHYPQDYEGMDNTLLWQHIHTLPRFWEDMSWKSDGKELWNAIKKYKPTILSALTSSDVRAEPGKEAWLKQHLPGVPFILVPSAIEKQKYARKDAILIDDLDKNIEQWISRGGIGILHTNTKDTLAQLANILEGNNHMIKKNGQLYTLYTPDGTKKLFSSTSYAAVVERKRMVEEYKRKAREKRKNK